MIRFLILTLALSTVAHAQNTVCKYGLGYGDCDATEKAALQRVAAAKTICSSGETSVIFNRENPPKASERSANLVVLEHGAYQAALGRAPFPLHFRYGCTDADLVVKYTFSYFDYSLTLTVMDADSGQKVFTESRRESDMNSDVTRMTNHWLDMVSEAKLLTAK